jgi:hypothetical protein
VAADPEEVAFKDQLQAEAEPPPPALAGYAAEAPILPGSIAQYWMPLSGERPAGKQLVYDPVVLAKATVALLDQRRKVDHRQTHFLALEPPQEGHAARWETAESLDYDSDELAPGPAEEALFGAVPESLNASKKLTALKKGLSDHLYINSQVTLLHNRKLDLYSQVGEELSDFQVRVREAADDAMDEEADKIKDRFEKKLDQVEDRLRREQRELEEAEQEYSARKREEALSAAESVMRFFGSRKAGSALSKASTKRRMTTRAKLEIEESEEQIKEYEEQLEELQRDLQEEIEELKDHWAEIAAEREEFHVRPRRADVQIAFLGLGWRPSWRDAS